MKNSLGNGSSTVPSSFDLSASRAHSFGCPFGPPRSARRDDQGAERRPRPAENEGIKPWQRSGSATWKRSASRSGPFSHVARVKGGEALYVAGVVATGETFEAQCAGVYAQIEQALKSAGSGWRNVMQFTTPSSC